MRVAANSRFYCNSKFSVLPLSASLETERYSGPA